jgi:hypothetical protein
MGGDIKGGGLTFYTHNALQNPSLVYGEGLTVPNKKAHLQLDNLVSYGTFGKRKSFERVKKY